MTPSRHGAPLRLALVQIKPTKGKIEENVGRIRSAIASCAADSDTDLLVFPEAALSGYFLEGGVSEAALSSERLIEMLGPPPEDSPSIVIGFYERVKRRLHNSVVFLAPGEGGFHAVHIHRKMFLPTYGVFDEARFVEPGREVEAFETPLGRMGMLICEEVWHSLPPTVLAVDGAELIIVVSASPVRGFGPGSGRPAIVDRWDQLASGVALEHGVFVAVSQLVGSEGGKLLCGSSCAVAPDGRILARGPFLEEAITPANLDGSEIDRARLASPLLGDLQQTLPHLRRALDRAVGWHETDRGPESDEGDEGGSEPDPPPALLGGRTDGGVVDLRSRLDDASILALDLPLVERTLVEFIRDEVVRRRGFRRVVIGLSGGVDSSVALHLAVRALGAENVQGFRLPYSISSRESLEHADLVIGRTGAQGRTIEITDAVDAYVGRFEPDVSDVRLGNICARLRSLILFDQSAKLRALPLGTGNKSERLLGYYTWHADDSPPINPLGDLFKTQVWALARHLGVPEEIVEKPATADLVKGVTDEDEIGVSYHRADPILHWLLRGYRPEALIGAGFERREVDLVRRRLDSTHWKRELPTVAVLSNTAIGEFYLRPVDY